MDRLVGLPPSSRDCLFSGLFWFGIFSTFSSSRDDLFCSRCFGSEFKINLVQPAGYDSRSLWKSIATIARRSRELTFRIGCSRGLDKVASAVSIPGRRFTVCEFVITSVALTCRPTGG